LRQVIFILCFNVFLLIAKIPGEVQALESYRIDAGTRAGTMAGKKHEYFHQYELFVRYGLPWSWKNSDGWGVDTNLEGTAGALNGASETGFIGSLGPGISFNKNGNGAAIDLGISVDALGRQTFGRQDFGTPYLFGAYLGLSYRWEIGLRGEYRLMHMSNGHIFDTSAPNPGLDLHMLGLSCQF